MLGKQFTPEKSGEAAENDINNSLYSIVMVIYEWRREFVFAHRDSEIWFHELLLRHAKA